MTVKQMSIKVNIPNFDTYSRPVQSFLNFFFQHASLKFYGSYVEDTLTSMNGAICCDHTTRVLDQDNYLQLKYNDSAVDFCVPFYNYFPSGFPEFPTLPVVTLPSQFTGDVVSHIPVSNTIPLSNSTGGGLPSLTSVNTLFGSYVVKEASDGMFYSLKNTFPFVVPVTLTSIIDGEENTNIDFRPLKLYNHELDTKGNPIQKVNMIYNNYDVDYQMRTSSFCIGTQAPGTDVIVWEDVYYKIGICPNGYDYSEDIPQYPDDPVDTMQYIKDCLMRENLAIHYANFTQHTGWPCTLYFSLQPRDPYSKYLEQELSSYHTCIVVNTNTESSDLEIMGIPDFFITPLLFENSGTRLDSGYLYFQLCKQDGSPYNDNTEIHNSVIHGMNEEGYRVSVELGFRFSSSEDPVSIFDSRDYQANFNSQYPEVMSLSIYDNITPGFKQPIVRRRFYTDPTSTFNSPKDVVLPANGTVPLYYNNGNPVYGSYSYVGSDIEGVRVFNSGRIIISDGVSLDSINDDEDPVLVLRNNTESPIEVAYIEFVNWKNYGPVNLEPYVPIV